MSAAALMTPGFYGKLPTAGDFVGRRLPAHFVRNWDRWVARHLVPLVRSGVWNEQVGLRFLLGPDYWGPMAGVVVASADRAGRAFPLTVAQSLSVISASSAHSADSWFDEVEVTAQAACRGELDAAALEAALANISFPEDGAVGESVRGLILWRSGCEPREASAEAPGPILEGLLDASWEIS